MTVNDIHSNFNVRIDRKNYKVVDDGKKCYKLEHKKIEKLRSEYVSIYSPINCEENYLNYYLSSTGFSDETEKFYLRKKEILDNFQNLILKNIEIDNKLDLNKLINEIKRLSAR